MPFKVRVYNTAPDGTFRDDYRLRSVEAVLFLYVDHRTVERIPSLGAFYVRDADEYQALVLELKDQPLWYGAGAIYHVMPGPDPVFNAIRYRLDSKQSGWRVPRFEDHAFFNPIAQQASEAFAVSPDRTSDVLTIPLDTVEASRYV